MTVRAPDPQVDVVSNAQWLAAEPFTLALSAGFFGFFAHTGLLLALAGRGLRPARVVGTSAGALAGGLLAAGVGARDLAAFLTDLRRDDFWDPGLPFGGLLRGEKFGALLTSMLPRGVETIEECAIPFAAVAHDPLRRRGVVLAGGSLERAIRASCALPLLFRPVRVEGRYLLDGGVSDRSGLSALSEGERCFYHHLPHQSPWPRLDHQRDSEAADASCQRRLVCRDLPRVSPFSLDRGRVAMAAAQGQAERWLDAPI